MRSASRVAGGAVGLELTQMSQHGESWRAALGPTEEAPQKGLPYRTTVLTEDYDGRAGSGCGLLGLAFNASG